MFTLWIFALPFKFKGLECCLIAKDQLEMKFKEQEDSDQYYDVKDNGNHYNENFKDIPCPSLLKVVNQGGNGTDKGDCVDQAEQDGIE